jgi:tetratricopeptide (TPR) repeat protein
MSGSKCPVCTRARGRRDCLLKEGVKICSVCCAQIRSEETCSDCPYFVETRRHETKKIRNKKEPCFFFEIRPELEEAIDQILIKMEKGKIDEVIPQIDALLAENPDYHLVHYAKGCLLAKQHNPVAAIPFFEEAVRINPNFLHAWANLSLASIKIMKMPRAAEAAREVLELDRPGSPIYAQAKDFLSTLNQIARKEGVSVKNYLGASRTFDDAFDLMEREDFEGARDGFLKSNALNPKVPATLGNLGLCHAYLGEKTVALEMIDNAQEINPDYEPARQNRSAIEKLEEGEAFSGNVLTINDPLET